MTRRDILNQWLGDRSRVYAAGVTIFEDIARDVHKSKYSTYFAQAVNPATFDPHFTQLVDVLSKIYKQMRDEPSLYPDMDIEIVTQAIPEVLNDDKLKGLIEEREAKALLLQEEVNDLTSKIESLEDGSQDHDNDLEELQSQLSQHEQQLKDIKSELEELSRPGVKVVTEADMPTTIKAAYARIKEITPLYGVLHADISNASIPDDERKRYAEQLCNLDDERRKLWAKVDAWSEGKLVTVDEKRPTYSDNATVRGFELMRARKRVKENIINSNKAAERAQKDGKQTVYDNAMKRIGRYEAELKEIEEEIANAGITE